MYILDDLYWGNINPTEKMVKENSEYRKLQKKSVALSERLRETLNREQKEVVKEQERVQIEIMSIMEEDAFISGFRIGARVMMDVLGKYESQFVPMIECKGM